MKMKKKALTLCLAVALAATAVVGGTMAYFTDTDDAVNVFTFGNVKIRQDEWQRDPETKAIEAFEDDKNVFPAVLSKLDKGDITVDGYSFKIRSLEGNYVDKIVNVTNEGTEKAYVRTIIAVPSMNGYDDSLNATENPLHWNYLDASDFNGTGWDWNGFNDDAFDPTTDKVADVNIDGVLYDLYIATYNSPLDAGATTSPSMVGFYLDDDVDCDENGYFSMQDGKRIDLSKYMKAGQDGKVTMEILVATQACQTEGFADAWEALDTCFGDITKDNNPWINN